MCRGWDFWMISRWLGFSYDFFLFVLDQILTFILFYFLYEKDCEESKLRTEVWKRPSLSIGWNVCYEANNMRALHTDFYH